MLFVYDGSPQLVSGGGGGKGWDHRYYSRAAAEEVKIGRKLKSKLQ